MDKNVKISELKKLLLDFRNKRDWKQFHNPKDLAEAISIESGELLELFLWQTKEEVKTEEKKPEAKKEVPKAEEMKVEPKKEEEKAPAKPEPKKEEKKPAETKA